MSEKSTNLMIGDWVHTPKGDFRITAIQDNDVVFTDYADDIDGAVDIKYIEPICIINEILEKNGWTYNEENEKFQPKTWSGNGIMLKKEIDCFRIVVVSDYDDEDTNDTPFVLRYVSDLQHALKLLKIEKEIVL